MKDNNDIKKFNIPYPLGILLAIIWIFGGGLILLFIIGKIGLVLSSPLVLLIVPFFPVVSGILLGESQINLYLLTKEYILGVVSLFYQLLFIVYIIPFIMSNLILIILGIYNLAMYSMIAMFVLKFIFSLNISLFSKDISDMIPYLFGGTVFWLVDLIIFLLIQRNEYRLLDFYAEVTIWSEKKSEEMVDWIFSYF